MSPLPLQLETGMALIKITPVAEDSVAQEAEEEEEEVVAALLVSPASHCKWIRGGCSRND